MRKIHFLVLVFIFFTNAISQEKIEKLALSDSSKKVYAILKADRFNLHDSNDEESEFLSDFFWHVEQFSKNQNIPVKFFECDSVYFDGKLIPFEDKYSSMIVFIKLNSKEYFKLDGLASDAVLAQEADKFYNSNFSKLIVGIWAENEEENALFYLSEDSIFYTDFQNHPYSYKLKNDTLKMYGDINSNWKILKLNSDSLWLKDDISNEITKLYKR